METSWRKCGSCKKDIPFNHIYQACSVSSCSKFAFCSVDCWDQHNPVFNHKSAWAEERRSPREADSVHTDNQAPKRIIVSSAGKVAATQGSNETEILIVASKLKQYVKEKYDMNTSGAVMEELSHRVRRITDAAAENARREGRKTIMDRDFK